MSRSHRGRGDPLTVDVTIDAENPATADTTVTEDLVAYDPDTGTLTFLSHHGPDGPVYDTRSFDRWARLACAQAGMDRLNDLLDAAFDDDMVNAVMTFEGDPSVAVSQTTTTFDRDGTIVSESTVDLDRLLDATPRSITATVSIADRSHTETFQATLQRQEEHLD